MLGLLLTCNFSYAATKALVPRANGEGSVGTSSKRWGDGQFSLMTVDGTLTVNGTVTTSSMQVSGTLGVPYGTTVPSSCDPGDIFIKTDAPDGLRHYTCLSGAFVTSGTGDITSVWIDSGGDVSALTAAPGDSLDAADADTSQPFKHNTLCSALVEDQGEGETCWDTDEDFLTIGDGTNEHIVNQP